MTFFFATLTEIWSDGEWQRLWDWKSLLSVALFGASFFIPKVVQRFRPPPSCRKKAIENYQKNDEAGEKSPVIRTQHLKFRT